MPLLPSVDCSIVSLSEIQSRHGDHLWFREMEDSWVAQELTRNTALIYYAPSGIGVETLDLDGNDCALLFVNGDLRVTGLIKNLNTGQGIHLAVAGRVQADAVIAGGSHICVSGDLCADKFVYGHYNDGSLKIGGSVHTPYWISNDHDMAAGEGFTRGTLQLDSDDGTFASEYDDYEALTLFNPENNVAPFVKEIYQSSGQFDPVLFYQNLCSDRPVFRPWEEWGEAYPLIRKWVVASHAMGWDGRTFLEATQNLLDQLAELKFKRNGLLTRIRGELLRATRNFIAQPSSDTDRLLDGWARQAKIMALGLPPAPAGKPYHEFSPAEEGAMGICRGELNNYAWYVYEQVEDPAAAVQAVEILQSILPWLVTWSNGWNTADTLVRLLLKLNRAEEAYAIIDPILTNVPNYSLFEDIANSLEYQAWKQRG